MTYDFTTNLDRHGRDAMAVDADQAFGLDIAHTVKPGFDRIPMWVADMNFPTYPGIPAALCERAAHPAFGYFMPPDAYYQAICSWHANRKGVTDLQRDDIGYENGVLGGLISALRVFCSQGDPVLVHSPTYIGFTGVLRRNGFHIVHSPLRRDGDGIWRMDLANMEEKIRRYRIHALVLCSPHNPTGRVWSGEELAAVMELCRRYDVYVVADEIWSDLLRPGQKHIATQSVSDDARNRTVALYAPSKTFNLAGLVGSYHVIYNTRLRDRVRRQGALSHYNEMNVLSMHALIAAYSAGGAEWVDELCRVLADNVDLACDHLSRIPGLQMMKPQATYMLFVDAASWCAAHAVDIETLLRRGIEVGVLWQDGRPFGGEATIRFNLASPAARIAEAMERLERYVFV
ncbi:MAG: MalY/PatB family protein [Anaerovoracaceae bacterium]|jgi:cystathionine beta-lyase